MKTQSIIIAFLFAASISSFGQQTGRTISKGVQITGNSTWVYNETLLQPITIDARQWTNAKEVTWAGSHSVQNIYAGNMVSDYPYWIVSKDVNRLAAPARAPKSLMPALIVRR